MDLIKYNTVLDCKSAGLQGMKREMTIEHLKCRTDLHFEVDFTVNGASDTTVAKWDLILFK